MTLPFLDFDSLGVARSSASCDRAFRAYNELDPVPHMPLGFLDRTGQTYR